MGGPPLNPEFIHLVQEAMQGRLPQVTQGEEEEKTKEEERVKFNNEKNKKEVCQGLTHGRCHFGWNGKGCSHSHPKPCRVYYTSNGFLCEDNKCRALKHHP